MPSNRKFYRRQVTVTILSEEPIPSNLDLGTIHYNVVEGDWSGYTSVGNQDVLDGSQAATALRQQGSDPEFFQLTQEGEDVE